MYGKFKCKHCKSGVWTSTLCSTEITYRYNSTKKQAEIKIAREFKQGCRSCNKETGLVFDQEATDIAMSKAIEIIKKVMYNLAAPANVSSEPHSQARDRKNPHDSSRCEACRAGVCSENVTRTVSSGQSRVFDDRYHGTQTKVGWALFVGDNFATKISVPNANSMRESLVRHPPRESPEWSGMRERPAWTGLRETPAWSVPRESLTENVSSCAVSRGSPVRVFSQVDQSWVSTVDCPDRAASRESSVRSVSRESSVRSVSRENSVRSVSRESSARTVVRETRARVVSRESSIIILVIIIISSCCFVLALLFKSL